jgi:multiple antibiotic resistance protein
VGEDLARASVSFFAIVDPIGNVVVFHLLARSLDRPRRLQVAAGAAVAALAMLAVFSAGGRELLDFLGISADSFKVAAGLLLLPPAFRLVTQGQSMDPREAHAATPVELALVPLAMPLLAGPGALAAAISFSNSVGRGTTVLAAAIVLGVTFLAFATSEWLFQRLGAPVLRLLSRVVGILLFAIAIDFVLEGANAFFDDL